MEKEFREDLNCPICLEIPCGEVFQCQNGHTICAKCCSRLTHCPQCRCKYPSEKIRNRLAESMLDRLDFGCKYKKEGCPQLLKRQELAAHSNKCIFRKPLVQICRHLGFKDCDFKLNQLNMIEAANHLILEHNFILREGPGLEISLAEFSRVSESSCKESVWNPIVFYFENEIFLVIIKWTKVKQCVAFICLCISSDSEENDLQLEAVFEVKGPTSKSSNLKWVVVPVKLRHAIETLLEPTWIVPMKVLQRYCSPEGNLLVQFSTREITDADATFESTHEEPTWAHIVPIEKDALEQTEDVKSEGCKEKKPSSPKPVYQPPHARRGKLDNPQKILLERRHDRVTETRNNTSSSSHTRTTSDETNWRSGNPK